MLLALPVPNSSVATTLHLHRQCSASDVPQTRSRFSVHVQGLIDFLPIRNVRTLVPQIRTLEGKGFEKSYGSSSVLQQPTSICVVMQKEAWEDYEFCTKHAGLTTTCFCLLVLMACAPFCIALDALYPKVRVSQCLLSTVQAATWFKRTFALKPALNQIRKERAEHRHDQSDQVDTMY